MPPYLPASSQAPEYPSSTHKLCPVSCNRETVLPLSLYDHIVDLRSVIAAGGKGYKYRVVNVNEQNLLSIWGYHGNKLY